MALMEHVFNDTEVYDDKQIDNSMRSNKVQQIVTLK